MNVFLFVTIVTLLIEFYLLIKFINSPEFINMRFSIKKKNKELCQLNESKVMIYVVKRVFEKYPVEKKKLKLIVIILLISFIICIINILLYLLKLFVLSAFIMFGIGLVLIKQIGKICNLFLQTTENNNIDLNQVIHDLIIYNVKCTHFYILTNSIFILYCSLIVFTNI